MEKVISKWGNSLALRLPVHVIETMHFEEGTAVDVDVVGNAVVIKPKKKKYTLKELVSKITKENSHGEIATGAAVGNEIW